MSAVLRHVAAARKHWRIDFQAQEGQHCVGRGVAQNTFAFGRPYPSPRYDAEVQILLYDTWPNFHDRPNTRVATCLHDRFGLPWVAEHGRYRVEVSRKSADAASALLRGHDDHEEVRRKNGVRSGFRKDWRYVAVHYMGDSSPDRKNLTHSQADDVCQAIIGLGFNPVILDWRRRSPLPYRLLRTPEAWGGDAEMVCAIIAQCEAFVGIDSGPSKCASSTDTPSLVVWTGHHPAPFHDPAPNTTHLVPRGYHGLEPVCDDSGVVRWFEAHHAVRQYDSGPVAEIRRWLAETLK